MQGEFDRIAAVGIVEHLGKRGIPALFRTMHDCLSDRGLALVHTIGSCTTGGTDPWLERTVFPGSHVPALSEIVIAAERCGLRVAHVENLGPHYALTLRHWLRRFTSSRAQVTARFGERFCRTWEMYLAMLVPTFEYLSTGLYQMVLTRGEGPLPEMGIQSYCGDVRHHHARGSLRMDAQALRASEPGGW
jgi:cyclopropane-fatty-acyl-phospholipid synthase